MRRFAVASAVVGAVSAACGIVLVALDAQSLHVWPTDRRDLWVALWFGWLATSAVVLAAGAIALGLLAPSRAGGGLVKAGRALAGVGALLVLGIAVTREVRAVSLRDGRHYIACLSNVKNIAMAIQMYASDYDRFPASERWCDVLADYIKNPDVYHCPQAPGKSGYAYNTVLDGLTVGGLPDPARVVGVFDADGPRNAHGGSELLPSFPRHSGGDNVGFPDGHAFWFARKRPAGDVRWNTVWPREVADVTVEWQPKLKGERGLSPRPLPAGAR